jgi:hypothetical protein
MGYFPKRPDRGRVHREMDRLATAPLPESLQEWLRAPSKPGRLRRGFHSPSCNAYVRIVTDDLHPESRQLCGLFRALDVWVADARLPPAQRDKLRRDLAWFRRRLLAPPYLAPDAVFWFKSGATTHVHRLWSIVRLLRRSGARPHLLRCSDLGRIVYQDAFQVAAVPDATTG